jgi:hypothetical protein
MELPQSRHASLLKYITDGEAVVPIQRQRKVAIL